MTASIAAHLAHRARRTEQVRLPAQRPAHLVDRLRSYSPAQMRWLLATHVDLAAQYQVASPYFEHTERGERLLVEHSLGHGITLQVGTIGAFRTEQIARMIQEQTSLYVLEQTMGAHFPTTDARARAELLSIMIGGYARDRLVVLIEKDTADGPIALAGVQAHQGTSEISMRDIAHARRPSSLSTFQSLRLCHTASPLLARFLDEHGDVPESRVVCLSRLFRQDRHTRDLLGIHDFESAWTAMACLALGLQRRQPVDGQPSAMPMLAIYDTHTAHIQVKLEALFGMRPLCRAGDVAATSSVEDTVLRFHYGARSQGGYIEDIVIGFVGLERYVNRARQYLHGRGSSRMLAKHRHGEPPAQGRLHSFRAAPRDARGRRMHIPLRLNVGKAALLAT